MTNMNKYNVMLCDDEPDVAETIISKLDWDSLGYNQPRYAHNGLEALEMAEESMPDVVMTDIRMPYMDGLTLAKKLKTQYPSIRIIIFSGFDEFEYAKEAIRLSAEEYILKPIDSEELQKVFERIHAALDKELDDRTNVEKLEAYYRQSLPTLQENFLSSLMEGNIPDAFIERGMKDYHIHLTGPYYTVLVIHTSKTHTPPGISPMLLSVSVRKLAEDKLSQFPLQLFGYLGNTCALVSLQKEDQINALTDGMDSFCRLAYGTMKAVVTVGVGMVVDNVKDLAMSYNGARQAVSYRVLYGTCKAINIKEIAPEEHDNQSEMEDANLREIFKQIRLNSKEGLKQAVHTFIFSNEDHMKTIQDYRFFVMDIMTEMYRFARSNHLDTTNMFDGSTEVYSYASRIEKTDLENKLFKECSSLQKLMNDSRSNSTRSFVTKAKDYVSENYYNENLSVESICSELGVSAAYFSTVFKKETGKPFTQYLTDVRMEKAVQLLMEKDLKTYIIAREVGYSDPNYFSYAFKKKFGVSPSKYKSGK